MNSLKNDAKLYFSDTVLEQVRKATNKGIIVGNDRFREEIEPLRPLVKIKSATDAPNFKSASRHANVIRLFLISVGVTPRAA